jgi:ankyrin repeat protein
MRVPIFIFIQSAHDTIFRLQQYTRFFLFSGAARKGHVDVVEYLLQWQQEQQQKQQHHTNKNDDNYNLLEATTLEGTTSFCWAAWQAHQDVLEVLYRAGCNVQATNDYGCNAILWCAQGGGGGGGGQDDNDSATSSRLCYTMEWLQSVGCRINQVNANGHSLVHKAAQRGRRDIICEWFFDKMQQQLLCLSTPCSALASCNIKTDSVATSCAENGQQILSLNQLLHLVGPDSGGCTPSDLACMEGHDELAEWIATEMEARLVTAAAAVAVSCRAAGRPGEDIIPNDETLPPSWLGHDPLPPVISCPNNMMDNSCRWGPWAGVRRMRAIWNQTLSTA